MFILVATSGRWSKIISRSVEQLKNCLVVTSREISPSKQKDEAVFPLIES